MPFRLLLVPLLLLFAVSASAQSGRDRIADPVASNNPTRVTDNPPTEDVVSPMPVPTNKDALKYRSGLPVPRFASLRSGKAYMRAGPGKEYRVLWVFTRPGLPLEVLFEWNVWRKVRDSEGTEGWMDRAMLSTDRTIQTVRSTRTLHARPDISSPVVWRAEPGVIARITLCADRWCRVEAEGRSGYLLREHGFGTYADEPVG